MKLKLDNGGSFELEIENNLDRLWASRFLSVLLDALRCAENSKSDLKSLEKFVEVDMRYCDDDDNFQECSGNRSLSDVFGQAEGQGEKESPNFLHIEDDIISINFNPNI